MEQLGSGRRGRGRRGSEGGGEGLGAFTRLALQLQAPREIPSGDPGLQGHQLLGGVLQEVGDVGLDEAKTAREGLAAGEADVTTGSPLPLLRPSAFPAHNTQQPNNLTSNWPSEAWDSEGEFGPPLSLVAMGKHP